MIGSTWGGAHRLKRIDSTISMIKKDWYSHQSMRTPFRKGMESTLDFEATRIPQLKTKKNKGLACRISRNKHMIEISSEVFVVGPHGLDHTTPSCTRQCTWHTKCPGTSIAKGSLRHNETTVKSTVNRRTTRRRTPISYHTSVGRIS